jgi:hypothetical protein
MTVFYELQCCNHIHRQPRIVLNSVFHQTLTKEIAAGRKYESRPSGRPAGRPVLSVEAGIETIYMYVMITKDTQEKDISYFC